MWLPTSNCQTSQGTKEIPGFIRGATSLQGGNVELGE